ncbi:BREX-4 system phosphatase PglZ [Pseudoramibacter faecis]|uniref:BREX-4 system phosphatase PglZ n=1 Tax=Pseudoramibacter faecis TaxID=3108534 RepID=UPI002E7741C9|nr:BREX-4 system phosphatase PglZ [Pseudoramibacter sp. HA2172]
MNIRILDDYFESTIHKPFFMAVGDTGYKSLIEQLKSRTVSHIYISECCRNDDKKPNMDIFLEKLETADVSFANNNIVVIGLGEYLALEGNAYAQDILSELSTYNLGSAQAFLLLRGVSDQLKELIENDRRLLESGMLAFDDDLTTNVSFKFSDPALGIYENNGIKSVLRELEKGKTGEIKVNTFLSFPNALFPIQRINNAYEAIDRVVGIKSVVQKAYGTDALWTRFLDELRKIHFDKDKLFQQYGFTEFQDVEMHDIVYGDEYRGWLFYVYLLYTENGSNNESYLSYVLSISKGFKDFKNNIMNSITNIPHTDSRFMRFYAQRKKYLSHYTDSEMATFISQNRLDASESVYKLTDNTKVEKQEVIVWISNYGFPDGLEYIYPDLYEYLQIYTFRTGNATLSATLTDYFATYKKLKLENTLNTADGEKFLEAVDKLAIDRIYNRLPMRDELVKESYSKDTQLFWVDALGVEYLSYIIYLAKKHGLNISIKIGRADLPTITCENHAFFDNWPEQLRHPKEKELDDLKHKEKGGYYYTKTPYPIHLADELRVIEKVMDEVATTLGLRTYDRIVIASDHGASRLAVIRNKEEKYDTDTQGEHSGRCCKYFEGCDLPFAIEEKDKGYIVLADYGRFKGSRKANVEVHGGASLEEVVVPVITCSLKDKTIIIAIINMDNIRADYKIGISFIISINKVVHSSVSVGYGSMRYPTKKLDDNHYEVKIREITKSGKYAMDIYIGEDLAEHITLPVKGKSASMNAAFDDLF